MNTQAPKFENIAVIPARSGSKRLPGKNKRMLGGIPMFQWSLNAAISSKLFQKIILTTDDPEIIELAKVYPRLSVLRRPAALAGDDTASIDVLMHATNNLSFKYVCLLQPTSPLRTANDILRSKALLLEENGESLVSVTKIHHPNHWQFSDQCTTIPTGFSRQIRDTKRDDFKFSYLLNGAIYWYDKDCLIKHKKTIIDGAQIYEMPPSRSIDVDTLEDFIQCEAMLHIKTPKDLEISN